MADALLNEAGEMAEQIRTWRRELHAHPELSGRERETARYVAGELRSMGIESVEEFGGGFGVVADVGPATGPRVALRADLDALPIQEETGAEYASTVPGVMHACGHDAHVAMLLAAARLLQNRLESLTRPVRLIFQPHEEVYPGGAAGMIEAGVLEGVGSIFGLHVCTNLKVGELGTRPGPFMAAVNPFKIVVAGKGGHAAMPDECVDPVVVAAEIVLALQTIVSRTIPISEPALVSVTRLEAGTADNVTPEAVEMIGTIRSFDESVRTHVCRRVREISAGVAHAHRATADTQIESGYPVLVNDSVVTARALDAARRVGFDERRLQTLVPQGGGEDFAYYCREVPGAFAFLGVANPEKGLFFPHHHPRFDIDEAALPFGAALLARFAIDEPASGKS